MIDCNVNVRGGSDEGNLTADTSLVRLLAATSFRCPLH
jgi:hypothetical protein